MLFSIILNIYNQYINNNNIFRYKKNEIHDLSEIQDKLEKGLLYNKVFI
jgi:hypothetical protein